MGLTLLHCKTAKASDRWPCAGRHRPPPNSRFFGHHVMFLMDIGSCIFHVSCKFHQAAFANVRACLE